MNGQIMEVMCCVCKRMKIDGEYVETAPKNKHMISHSYCPSCAKMAMENLEKLQIKMPPICPICKQSVAEQPETIYCHSCHQRCGICGKWRVDISCQCLRSVVM